MIALKKYKNHKCFGYTAGILGILSTLPQLHKTLKTRDAKSFSMWAIIIGLVTSILWLSHSYFMDDSSGLMSSTYGLFYRSFLLYAKLNF